MDIERYLESPVIAVRVGKNEVTFNIHKSLLMEKSALFRNHLQIRGNANAPSMKISIVEDGRHFAPFAVWMYNEHEDVLDTKSKPPYHFGQLWTLAEEIESNDYLNFLADRIQRLLGTANIDFSVKSYDELLSVRRGDSAMGKFIIDCMAYSVATKGFQQIIGDDSNSTQAGEWFGGRAQLLHRLILSVNGMAARKNPKNSYDCTLHRHDTEDEQENCPRYGKQETDDPTESAKSEGKQEEATRTQKRARLDEV